MKTTNSKEKQLVVFVLSQFSCRFNDSSACAPLAGEIIGNFFVEMADDETIKHAFSMSNTLSSIQSRIW